MGRVSSAAGNVRRLRGSRIIPGGGKNRPGAPGFRPSVDVLKDLRKAGWIVLEVWVAEPGNRGHARRRHSAAQAYCTESGREAPELIGG
jgi:hypothetical protein